MMQLHEQTSEADSTMGSATVPMVVAIDGPVGVGKSTVARRLAAELGWRHLDTGAMYRAVTLLMRESGHPLEDKEHAAQVARDLHLEWHADGHIFIGDRDITRAIRDEKVSRRVAIIADNIDVRRALVDEQRRQGLAHPCVAEGRDMATVVFTDAPFKFYLDASPDARTERRARQLEEHGREADRAEIRLDLDERDRRDRARVWGGLKPADDARIIDTTNLMLDQVVALLAGIVRADERVRAAEAL